MQKSRAFLTVIIGTTALIGGGCLNDKQPKIRSVLYNMETVLEGRAEIEKKFNSTFSKCKDKGRERMFVVTDEGLTEFDNLGLEISLENRDYIDDRNELDFHATARLVPKNEVPAEESKQIPYRRFDRNNRIWATFQPFDYARAATITVKKEKGKWSFWTGRLDVYRAPKSSCAAIINETPLEDDLYSLRELEQKRLQDELAKQMESQRISEEQERRRRETEVLEGERRLYESALGNAKSLAHKMPRCGSNFFAVDDDFLRSSRCFYKLRDVQEQEVDLKKAGYVKNGNGDFDEQDREPEKKKPVPKFVGTVKLIAIKAEKHCYTLTRHERKHLDYDQRVRTDITYTVNPAIQDLSFTAISLAKTITIECNGDDCSITSGGYSLPCAEIVQSLKQPRTQSEEETNQRGELFEYMTRQLRRKR
nr:hypothetical protein [Nitrosomonas nitrosa]